MYFKSSSDRLFLTRHQIGKREKIQLTGPSTYIIASILPIYYLIFELSIEYLYYGSSHRRCSVKKSCSAGLQLYEKETPTQVISCEICEFYKNNYFEEHLRTTASFTNTPICSLKFIFQTSSRVSHKHVERVLRKNTAIT